MKDKSARAIGTTDLDGALPLEATEYKVYLLIIELWKNGMDSVHNIRVVNTDANSHSAKKNR